MGGQDGAGRPTVRMSRGALHTAGVALLGYNATHSHGSGRPDQFREIADAGRVLIGSEQGMRHAGAELSVCHDSSSLLSPCWTNLLCAVTVAC